MTDRDQPAARDPAPGDRAFAVSAAAVADIGLGVILAVLLAFWAHSVATSWGPGYWPFGCVAGTVVSAIALARRRRRVLAAVAGQLVALSAALVSRLAGLPAEPGPAAALALAVLTASAVRTLAPRAACAVALGGLVVVAATALRPATGIPPVTALNAGAWLAGLAAGLGARALAARREAMAEAVRRHERLQLARELHDVVAHHVTGIVLQSQAAQVLARRRPERVESALTGIETAGADALAAMRRLVGLLRDAAPPAPPPESLAGLAARFDGPPVHLRLPEHEDGAAWPPEITGTVYRVVREALTNVSRHARAARAVHVTVAREPGTLTVEISDDAPPAPARRRRAATGYGLLGMRERVTALGGTLHAGPRPGAPGWSVRATLPLPPPTGSEPR
ncbi:histidine kinase [Nonomuraea wenchangensis]